MTDTDGKPWSTPVSPNPSIWEHREGTGKPLTIDDVISKLQAIRREHGNIPCELSNYLEGNVIAPITNLRVDDGEVIAVSDDLPETEEPNQ